MERVEMIKMTEDVEKMWKRCGKDVEKMEKLEMMMQFLWKRTSARKIACAQKKRIPKPEIFANIGQMSYICG